MASKTTKTAKKDRQEVTPKEGQSMSDIQLTVIIPAAAGVRFGGDKLSEELGGRPVLLRTVEFFAKRDDVHQIIVAGPAESDGSVDAAFESRSVRPCPSWGSRPWRVARSEPTRCEPLCMHWTTVAPTWPSTMSRPLIDDALMDRMVEAAAKTPAVIPGVSVRDTLKRVSSESRDLGESADAIIDDILGDAGRVSADARVVEATVDRDQLVAIQTPSASPETPWCRPTPKNHCLNRRRGDLGGPRHRSAGR